MKMQYAALAAIILLSACSVVVKPPLKAEPAQKPVVKTQPQGDITKADKDKIKGLLDQAIKKADCSDPASKDDPTCAKQ